MVREVLKDTLKGAGYQVLVAADGVDALASLAENRVDLVISDVNMPVMDGYALYDRVRSRPDWIPLPFVMLTAVDEPARIRYAKELGVDDYLVKPVASEDLLSSVRALLKRRAQLEGSRSRQIAEIKNTILTTLAHELRTPLTTVQGYAELLREAARPAEAEGLRALVEGVLAGADRLRRLADDLVTLVDIRSGDAYGAYLSRRAPLRGLGELLAEVREARRQAARSRGVDVSLEVGDRLPEALGDTALLGEAMVRLLDNAIKFSRGEGAVAILRARALPRELVLEVEDNGLGIPPSEQTRLWEVFYQVDRSRNEQQGAGCGLSIVHSVALMHGGRLEVTSALGKGSTFALHLPARSA